MKRKLISVSVLILSMVLQAQDNVSKVWTEFEGQSKKGVPTELPDFSYAGYHHGEVGIPHVDHKVFDVTAFGAVPNDGQSDRAAIERSIAAATKNGSGIIFFPKGRFLVHEDSENTSPITIKGKHIVMRGSGSGQGGTELYMKHYLPAKNPTQLWTCPYLFNFVGAGVEDELTRVTADATRGEKVIKVKSAAAIRAGEWIVLRVKNSDKDLLDHDMCGCKVAPEWTKIKSGVYVNEYHLVESVKGKTVTLKAPISHDIDADHNWKILSYAHYEEVGVEDIAFVGNWKGEFVHHKNSIHDGGYSMVKFNRIANGWITRCRFTDVNRACSISQSSNISVLNCTVTGTPGHSSISSGASTRVLVGLCDDSSSQWHAPGVSSAVLGTVFWRVNYNEDTSFETHASQPRATLFDCVRGGFFIGRGGGARQNLPNHMEHLVLWNFNEIGEAEENFEFWSSQTWFWKIIPPYLVGFHGAGSTFNTDQVEVLESLGEPVYPTSLYEAQLALRLGQLPAWVEQVKTTE